MAVSLHIRWFTAGFINDRKISGAAGTVPVTPLAFSRDQFRRLINHYNPGSSNEPMNRMIPVRSSAIAKKKGRSMIMVK